MKFSCYFWKLNRDDRVMLLLGFCGRNKRTGRLCLQDSSRLPFLDAMRLIIAWTCECLCITRFVVTNSYRVILGPFYPFPEPWGIYFITARLAKSMHTKASTAIYKPQTKYHSKKPPPQRGESPVS